MMRSTPSEKKLTEKAAPAPPTGVPPHGLAYVEPPPEPPLRETVTVQPPGGATYGVNGVSAAPGAGSDTAAPSGDAVAVGVGEGDGDSDGDGIGEKTTMALLPVVTANTPSGATATNTGLEMYADTPVRPAVKPSPPE